MSIIFALAPMVLVMLDAEPAQNLRYLRRAKDAFTLESAITRSTKDSDRVFTSHTDRGSEKMTLKIHWKNEKLVAAELVQETAPGKATALLAVIDGKGNLVRGTQSDTLENVRPDSIVTTAPDWSDILQLVERYDDKKAGKQEYPGLWIHPTKPTLRLAFTVERIGKDTIRVKDKDLALDRYRIRLRSGDYLVWADESRRVIKLFPANSPAAEVVLEGFEESTKSLR